MKVAQHSSAGLEYKNVFVPLGTIEMQGGDSTRRLADLDRSSLMGRGAVNDTTHH
jgi:hypothetical protein